MDKNEFIDKMLKTDYIIEEMELREFADFYYENLISFEENRDNYFKWISN